MAAQDVANAAAAFFGTYTAAKSDKKREDRQNEQWRLMYDLSVQREAASERRYQESAATDALRLKHQQEQLLWEREQAGQVSPNNVFSSLINQGYTPEQAQGVAEGRIPASTLGTSPAMQLRQQAAARVAGGGSGGRGGQGGPDYTAAQTGALHEAAAALGIPIGTPAYNRIFTEGLSLDQAGKLRQMQNQQGGMSRLEELQNQRDEIAVKAESNGMGVGAETQAILDRLDAQINAVKGSLGGQPQQQEQPVPMETSAATEGRNPDGTRQAAEKPLYNPGITEIGQMVSAARPLAKQWLAPVGDEARRIEEQGMQSANPLSWLMTSPGIQQLVGAMGDLNSRGTGAAGLAPNGLPYGQGGR